MPDMSPNAFFYGLDNAAEAGDFFVALAQGPGDRPLTVGEDVMPRLRGFGLSLPSSLAKSSIVSVAGDSIPNRAPMLHSTPLNMVITYPAISAQRPEKVKVHVGCDSGSSSSPSCRDLRQKSGSL